jgi:hypothetical protein
MPPEPNFEVSSHRQVKYPVDPAGTGSLTFEVIGRLRGAAAEGTCKHSLQGVRVDQEVRERL